MNQVLLTLGIEGWKPVLTALVLPPVPFIVLMLVGARLMFRRRMLAWLLVLLGASGMWFGSTEALAKGLTQLLLQPPRSLSPGEINDLKRAPKTAIVVLGGGRRVLAPEYGIATLQPRTTERLRFGVWLSRETGLPVAFSGGVGHGSQPGASEADIAARVAEREFGRPLRWIENESRDTRENAIKTVALLQAQGIEQIVVVTEDYHMPRALRHFQRAAEGSRMRIVAAPMGAPSGGRLHAIDWLPTLGGMDRNWLVLHEWVGRLAGA